MFTCSSAALQLSPSNSHRPSLLLPPHSPHSHLFCHASTLLRPPATPTSIASAATDCFTVGSSAGSLITCRAWWDCRWLHRARLPCAFERTYGFFFFFDTATMRSCICRLQGGQGVFGLHLMCACWVGWSSTVMRTASVAPDRSCWPRVRERCCKCSYRMFSFGRRKRRLACPSSSQRTQSSPRCIDGGAEPQLSVESTQ